MPTGLRLHATRSLTLRIVMLLTLLAVPNVAASAGDFVLNYAIDADGKTDAGKLENCGYEHVCEIHAADLNIQIVVHPSATGLPTMDMIVRGPPDCCYTVDATQQLQTTLRPGLLRVAIYRRVWRDRDEFVRNAFLQTQRIGAIHLAFSQLR
jgi:hypothetical protein